MMKATQNRDGADVPSTGRRFYRRLRNPLLQSLVRSGRVEIVHILPEHTQQMPLIQDKYVVQTFPSHTPKESFAYRVHQRRPVRDVDVVDPCRPGHVREERPVLAVVVGDEVLGALTERGGL